jgi:dUTP pyrophosphatase
MEVKVKKLHTDAVLPKYAKPGDAGMDLVAISRVIDTDAGIGTFGTGLAFEIPEGYVGLIFPRSSSYKQQSIMTNSVAVIDSGYRGEVMVKFYQAFDENPSYQIGDKIAQIMIVPYPEVTFIEAEELTETERGNGGFGSTGK